MQSDMITTTDKPSTVTGETDSNVVLGAIVGAVVCAVVLVVLVSLVIMVTGAFRLRARS